jgi:hypothetical protein
MVEPVMSFTVIGAPQSAAAEQTVATTSTALAINSATTAFMRIANESIKPIPQLEAPLMANPKALTPVGAAEAGAEAAEGEAAADTAAEGEAATTP